LCVSEHILLVKKKEKEMGRISLPCVNLLPATLTYTRYWHCVAIHPNFAVWCDIFGTALYLVRITLATDFSHFDLLAATTAFLVWQK
jgi:hypothetical protein